MPDLCQPPAEDVRRGEDNLYTAVQFFCKYPARHLPRPGPAHNPTSYRIEEKTVTSADVLTVVMAKGGGQAVSFIPMQ